MSATFWSRTQGIIPLPGSVRVLVTESVSQLIRLRSIIGLDLAKI